MECPALQSGHTLLSSSFPGGRRCGLTFQASLTAETAGQRGQEQLLISLALGWPARLGRYGEHPKALSLHLVPVWDKAPGKCKGVCELNHQGSVYNTDSQEYHWVLNQEV